MRNWIVGLSSLILIIGISMAQDDLLAEVLDFYSDDIGIGMVLFVEDHGETSSAVSGVASLEGVDITIDDYFRIGSVTKPMVAVAVLKLVDDGLIRLDDPIATYLPDDVIADITNADTATVRQMLQMTSGIYSYTESDAFDDAVQDNPLYAWTAQEVLDYVRGEEAYFEAGEDYYYSNTNYILAEILIEEVDEISLADALKEWIFEPADMDTCYLEIPDIFAENIVRGYAIDDDGEWVDITDINDGVGLGDGGVVCTAEDLAKFLPAILNGDLVSSFMVQEMLNIVDDGEGSAYGLGIGYDDTEFGVIISHDGATSGFQSTMQYIPNEDLSLVILTNNFDSEIVADVTYDTFTALFDME